MDEAKSKTKDKRGFNNTLHRLKCIDEEMEGYNQIELQTKLNIEAILVLLLQSWQVHGNIELIMNLIPLK